MRSEKTTIHYIEIGEATQKLGKNSDMNRAVKEKHLSLSFYSIIPILHFGDGLTGSEIEFHICHSCFASRSPTSIELEGRISMDIIRRRAFTRSALLNSL